MARSLRIILAFLLVAVLAAGAAIVFSLRPPLDTAERALDARWRTLGAALEPRYDALDREVTAAAEVLDEERPLLKEARQALSRWDKRSGNEPDEQTALANQLEGVAARIDTFVASSPRLRASEAVRTQARAFDDREPRQAAQAHAAALDHYEAVRTKLPRRLVASALGYGARRSFEPS